MPESGRGTTRPTSRPAPPRSIIGATVSLAPGVRVGPYEVISSLGAGGMGEVYRARDTTLGREVALKVLPDTVAHDGERIARFRREAQLLAALNHPLIASIYGIADFDGALALVLELVEGTTLAERLAAGPMALDEALRVAHQLTEALAAAHERGIVHRDLKPSNIKLRPDGTVKVLDFGLARALEPPATVEAGSLATVTSPAVTAFGVILGTAAYMSPEQACGQTTDRTTDIWAFGAVLFEMLTGTRTFEGSDPTQTVASVLRSPPDWSRLPASTPESLRRLLRRCLEKDRRRRLADIHDAALDIEEAQRGEAGVVPVAGGVGWRERLLWMTVVVLAAAVAAALLVTRSKPAPMPAERRVEIVTPPTTDPVSLALSPDGRQLAFVAASDGRSRLWVRDLESGATKPLQGTDGASLPFWSPDSQSIGYFAGERLRRARLDGSLPKILGRAVIGTGGTWNQTGTILFPTVPDSPLLRLEDGGQPAPMNLTVAQRGGHRYPYFLPDGRHFLFFHAELRAVFLGSTEGPSVSRLFDADAAAIFAPPSDVLFVRGGALNAQRFDVERLNVTGNPVPLAAGIAISPSGGAAISASANGTIAYRTGVGALARQVVWVSRAGDRTAVVGNPDAAAPINLSLSPDGRHALFNRSVDGNTDIWMMDVERGIPMPLTRQPAPDIAPTWSHDGRSIVYSSARGRGAFEIRIRQFAGESDTPLKTGPEPLLGIPMDCSADGKYILYRATGDSGQWDIWAVPTLGDRTPIPVVASEYRRPDRPVFTGFALDRLRIEPDGAVRGLLAAIPRSRRKPARVSRRRIAAAMVGTRQRSLRAVLHFCR